MATWIDSHSHIFCEDFENDVDEVIARAKANGFSRIMVVCCTLAEAEKALAYREKELMLDIAVGFHPSDIEEFSEADWHKLEQLAHNPNVAAIGEIGLDLHWTPETQALQQEAFIRQINLANQVHKPIIVHSRDATQLTYECLKQHPALQGGVIHCFSSSSEMAKEFIKLGYCIGLGGPVTFKNAKTPKEVAQSIPLEALLIETDCPYLTPTPYRGKRNEPMYAAISGEAIAELRGITKEALQEATCKNYQRLFHEKLDR